jgi:thiamine biosynthesis lipoprotein
MRLSGTSQPLGFLQQGFLCTFVVMHKLYPLALALGLLVAVFPSCKDKQELKPVIGRYYTGVLFGKPYSVDVVGDSTDYRASMDSIIAVYEAIFNTLDPNALLSQINAFASDDSLFTFVDSTHAFGLVYDWAKDLHRITMQYYDPTGAPLKRAWLLTKSRGEVEPNLDSLFDFVGFDHSAKGNVLIDLNELTSDGYTYTKSQIRKTDPRVELDFSTMAGAAALDQISAYLTEKGVAQFRIKYGRSVICGGKPIVDTLHVVPMGIGYDTADQYVRFTGSAYAARSAQDKLGMVDPTYGYPVSNEMVFVSVVAPTLTEAEVFSEAFMIMGLDRAAEYYTNNEQSRIESFMLYEREKQLQSASTEGFDRIMLHADSLENP